MLTGNGKKITVDTVQGIGDLIWLYRKLAPVYDEIDVNILVTHDDTVQRRAEEFLKLLDKIRTVKFKVVSQENYSSIAKAFYTVDSVVDAYAVNAWLESGIHITAIDDSPVCWNLGITPDPPPISGEYLLVYVSGCMRHSGLYQMDSSTWARLIGKACKYLDVAQCVLIGAEYDSKKLHEVAISIPRHISRKTFVNYSMGHAISCIAGAKYFIAYQSGLCMLAEEFGTPTFVIYYPENSEMAASWIRRENLEKGLIKASFFGVALNFMSTVMRQHIRKMFPG